MWSSPAGLLHAGQRHHEPTQQEDGRLTAGAGRGSTSPLEPALELIGSRFLPCYFPSERQQSARGRRSREDHRVEVPEELLQVFAAVGRSLRPRLVLGRGGD